MDAASFSAAQNWEGDSVFNNRTHKLEVKFKNHRNSRTH